ncbi:lipoprotein-anchoring transpeptidase ErfK/SrfK [Haloactinopolyspora alba]|uniref:Lipoprotein-anchoring transpeptidase ErfK/SrfK n=1 Tax=Haloactinopolyspora alba TaxID=648780 RepID=A0A2P8E7M4_9ACTN|nr:Ig-like domain-containing protein [Haloactinopolyspora alba]PSL05460.1 lipoprotein-anchoring transpeptidase ErfK/SrfK [Haloactinopolyspora alba]
MRTRRTAVVLTAVALLTAACSGSDDQGSGGGGGTGEPAEEAGPKSLRTSLRLEGVGGDVNYDKPIELTVPRGEIDSVEVKPDGGEPVAGQVSGNGSTWRSEGVLEPGGSYDVNVVAADHLGRQHTLTDSFTVASVPDSERLTLTMQPGDGSVVGVGAPITVRFDQEVSNQKAVQQNMHVSSSPQVQGSWHWISSTEVHFRPRQYWPAGTHVGLNLDLNGVRAGENLWGGRAYDLDFQIGPKQVAQVDAESHTMTVRADGKSTRTWDTSLGAPEFATRNGTYIVLEKFETKRMTSCGANITCDKSNPEYYDLKVDNSVRLSWSGTFVHSASWSEGSQGSENVSHGCINLSHANGATFFDLVRYGDLVTVKNSTRGPGDLVSRGDPGMADWNLSWPEYVEGSATGDPLTTAPL